LGLIIPAHFKSGSAWGEWDGQDLQRLVGYVPQGFKELSLWWNAPIPGYAFKGWEDKGLPHLSFAYIISAIVGILTVVLAALLIGRFLTKKGN
jgi:hypothetical protein